MGHIKNGQSLEMIVNFINFADKYYIVLNAK